MNICKNIIDNTEYWLKGAIDISIPIYLTYNKDKVVYLLTYDDNNDVLVFSPLGKNPIPLIISLQSSGLVFSFKTLNNTIKYLSIDNNDLLITSNNIYIFNFITNLVNSNTNSILTGIPYHLLGSDGRNIKFNTYIPTNTAINISGYVNEIENNSIIIDNIGIVVLPYIIYGCNKCSTLNNNSYITEGCWISNDYTLCTDIEKNSAFTTQSDCNIGIWYTYCGLNNYCSNNCNGPCPNGNSCLYNNINGTYYCQVNENTTTKKEYWLIIGSLVLFILIILILLILYYYK